MYPNTGNTCGKLITGSLIGTRDTASELCDLTLWGLLQHHSLHPEAYHGV